MEVPLTTVAQDAAQLGQRAARLLLERMQETTPHHGPIHDVIQTRLIVRRSSVRQG
jgi:DNA-binding LacI/PurR family transcriptional regulator